MKRILSLFFAVAFSTSISFAGTGWLDSYAKFWNGTSDLYYDLGNAGSGTPEPVGGTSLGSLPASLGTFNLGYTLFLNAEISAWADGGDAYSQMTLNYRVYESTPGSFTADNVDSINNIGGNNWRGIAEGNSLGGFGVGTYTVDIYLTRSHTWDAGAGGPYTTHYNALGDTAGTAPTANFFTTQFTVVPEPGTIALFGLGMAGLVIMRRRKA